MFPVVLIQPTAHLSYCADKMKIKGLIIGILLLIIISILFLNKKDFLSREFTTVKNVLNGGKDVKDIQNSSRPILGFLNYRNDLKEKLAGLIHRKAPALDAELITFVKEVMDQPAPKGRIKMSRVLAKTPQAEVIDEILHQKTNGFYIEAGGYDGERSSNTIWFEKTRNWKGLLVEPDPFYYTQLIGKNRNAWSINACISPLNYVSEIAFSQSLLGSGKLDMKPNTGQKFKVPCYPLETMLQALGVSEVDYFSLDVEGVEGIILETIPYDKLNITSFSVEYIHGDKQRYIDIMKKNGYKMQKELVVHKAAITLWVDDFIFVKTNT